MSTIVRHDTPAEEVFFVAELLDNILLRLSMDDILRCRRVNRSSYSNIADSKPLQRKLFLLPDVEDSATPITMRITSTRLWANFKPGEFFYAHSSHLYAVLNIVREPSPLAKAMLITQLPMKNLKIGFSGERRGGEYFPFLGIHTISLSRGTFGELWQALEKLLDHYYPRESEMKPEVSGRKVKVFINLQDESGCLLKCKKCPQWAKDQVKRGDFS